MDQDPQAAAGTQQSGRGAGTAPWVEVAALFGRLGCITGEVADVSQVVDEAFVNYAVGVLGPYAR